MISKKYVKHFRQVFQIGLKFFYSEKNSLSKPLIQNNDFLYFAGLMTNSIFDSVIKLFGSERAEDGFTFVKNLTEFVSTILQSLYW